ncbi:aspartate aminotransferase-like enzyme/enoyl-CoA hydratase/carnithine racemase [Bradyrhizobium sp. LM2.7]
MTVHSGRHFLQIPGPTNVPDRVLRAMDMPTLDHRGPEFAELGFAVLASMQRVFRTKQPVIIFPSSGTGAWEAAMVNVFAPGDKLLMCETGQFAMLWRGIADRFKLEVDFIPSDWRHGAGLAEIEQRLSADKQHTIKAVCVVHNETSTGCVTPPLEVRKLLDRVKHPALLMVDTISGLGSMEYEHDAWGIDVSVAGSQKGLMLPPGLGFNAVSEKALAVAKANPGMRSYWDWQEVISFNKLGTFPYTPATNLLYGLREAIKMLEEEGLENVWTRHKRHSAATRAAVKVWGLETQCADPAAHSPALTGVRVPEGHDADAFRKVVLENFDMSLGTGLNKVKGKVFRIGHIGHFNDLMLMGTLAVASRWAWILQRFRTGAAAYWRPWTSSRDATWCRWPRPRSLKINNRESERAMNLPVTANEDLLYSVQDGIARITFNRPQARNALTFAMYERMAEICQEINADRSIKALILTGTGDKAFASGTDISQFRAFKTAQDALDYEARIDRVLGTLEQCRVPVIAAIAGACTGGGAGIAACCDLRIGTESTRIGFPIARTLGNCLSMSNISRVVSLVGPARTKDLIFKARLVEAQEALSLGLLNEVVPDVETLHRRADETAKLVASHAPLTLEATKEAVRRIRRTLSREEGEDLILKAYMSEDFREGMDAFLNKRTPSWKGK